MCCLEQEALKYNADTQNLDYLFSRLPASKRSRILERYTVLLNSKVEPTWDVCQSLRSFLKFLGRRPIVRSRYPWQVGENVITLFDPNHYRQMTFALNIELFNYPTQGPFKKRYNTQVKSLRNSREHKRTAPKAGQITSSNAVNHRSTFALIENMGALVWVFRAFPKSAGAPMSHSCNICHLVKPGRRIPQ